MKVKKQGLLKTFFTLIKGFIGTGILFLPKGFENGGYLFSPIALLFAGALTCYCTTKLLAARKVNGD